MSAAGDAQFAAPRLDCHRSMGISRHELGLTEGLNDDSDNLCLDRQTSRNFSQVEHGGNTNADNVL